MLLGRERERLILDRLLEGARAGTSGVLAIVGEAGIGKSALLAYALEQAHEMRVLRARGVRTEAHIPFAGLFELLRPALGSLHQTPGPQAAALEGALALRPARAQDRFAIGAATLSLLAAHAEAAPLAVLVDVAHALDGSSADSMLFAIRRLVADPVTVVLTIRRVCCRIPTSTAGRGTSPRQRWVQTLITQGMARIFSGEGDQGATLVREATGMLERSVELRNDRACWPGRPWAHCGSVRRTAVASSSNARWRSPATSQPSGRCHFCSATWASTAPRATAGPRPRRRFTKPSTWPARRAS